MKKTIYVFILAAMFAQALYSQPWQTLPGGSLNDRVTSVISFGGYLWVGGAFSAAGPISANCIVRHDGSQWIPTPGLPSPPLSFSIYANELYALGGFSVAGNRYGMMKWSGTAWIPMAQIESWGVMSSSAIYSGELIVGGYFYSVDGMPAQSRVRWNAGSWQTFSGQTSCFWLWPPRINGLYSINGWLYACGAFDMIGGTNANCAAKWNGSAWVPLDIGWNTYASAFADSAGSVFIVGIFPYAGAAASHSAAREGASGWVNAGNGVALSAFAAAAYHNKVYVGGAPLVNGGDYVGSCGYWNGISWTQDDQGLNGGFVSALYYDQATDNLYAGGAFNSASSGSANYIAYKGSGTLPVELISFTCAAQAADHGSILLQWVTASETNASHFRVSVSVNGYDYESIGIVAASGTTTAIHTYSLVYALALHELGAQYDPKLRGRLYYFRLEQFDIDGSISGPWDAVMRSDQPDEIQYHSASQVVSCACDDELSIFSPSGQLLQKGRAPISLKGYSPGCYCAIKSGTFETLRFIVLFP